MEGFRPTIAPNGYSNTGNQCACGPGHRSKCRSDSDSRNEVSFSDSTEMRHPPPLFSDDDVFRTFFHRPFIPHFHILYGARSPRESLPHIFTMTERNNGSNGSNGRNGAHPIVGTDRVKQGLAQMLKGGVIVRLFVVEFALNLLLFNLSV
jgi:hypothetical protein